MRQLPEGWLKSTRSEPCPICERDSCITSPDGQIVMCYRVQEGSYRDSRQGGWLHRLGDGAPFRPPDDRPRRVELPPDWTEEATNMAAQTPITRTARLAKQLGVSVLALRQQMVSWHDGAWVWPMWWMLGRDQRVVGMRLRVGDRKFARKGSRAGLFVPGGFADRRDAAPFVLVCEGPTDAAAGLTMGFLSVGIPSAGGCIDRARDAVAGKPVVIVADADQAGRRSAELLHHALGGVVVEPPGGSDLRQWSQQPGCRHHIQAVAKNLLGVGV